AGLLAGAEGEIREDEVVCVVQEERLGLRGAADDAHLVALLAKESGQRELDRPLVIHDEESLFRARSACAGRGRRQEEAPSVPAPSPGPAPKGRVIRNSAPLPGALVTSMLPPCSSMIF